MRQLTRSKMAVSKEQQRQGGCRGERERKRTVAEEAAEAGPCRTNGSARAAPRRRSSVAVVAAACVAVVSCVSRGAEAVSNGGHHSCSAFDDGTVKCWGANESGQLGLGDLTARGARPAQMGDGLEEVNLGTNFFAIGVSCGLDHSCAWSKDGRVKCWGGNQYGQLGLGDRRSRGGTALSMGDKLPFVNLGPGEVVEEVVAANHFTCALLQDETLKCFGRNDWGQLGSGDGKNNLGDAPGEMGSALPRVELVPEGANYTVSVLTAHNGPCVIMQSDVAVSKAVKCWGPNGYGSLGVGDMYNRGDDANEMGGNLPAVDLGTGVEPVALATGMDFVCALTATGGVKCWGRNCNGQGGFGDIETYGDDPNEMGDNLPFVDLGTGLTAVAITAGDAHVCALLDDGSLKCWGKGFFGQLGLEDWHSVGQTTGQLGDSLPSVDLGTAAAGRRRRLGGAGAGLRGLQAAAPLAMAVDAISAGGQRSCAIVDGGSVKCWGSALAGALGLGDTADRGGRPGSMGNSLPMLSLGTGKVAVSPTPVSAVVTIAPTPAPTLPPMTPAPSEPAIRALPATLAPSVKPSTPFPTAVPASPPSPAPTTAATAVAESRGGFEALADEVGVTVTQGIAIAAGVPLLALLVCCCFGFCVARKKKKKEAAEVDVLAADSKSPPAGRAASVAPASAVGSRTNSIVDGSLANMAARGDGGGIFYSVGGGDKKAGNGDGALGIPAEEVGNRNADAWATASRRAAADEEEKGDADAARLSSARADMLGGASGYKQVTPTNLEHRASSSETPPNKWGEYEAQPIDSSGSFTPESNAGGSVLSRGESARSGRMQSLGHSRNASGLAAAHAAAPSPSS